jgi:hypothetical protein
MDREQPLLPTEPRALALDLEAQRNKGWKAPGVSHEDPVYTNTVDLDILTTPLDVDADADGIENPLVAGGLDKEGKLRMPRSGVAQRVTAQPLSMPVETLKHRYNPFWVEAPEVAGDVLSFLHHRNISHLRANLLKQYSFLCVNAKLYFDGMEPLLFAVSSH